MTLSTLDIKKEKIKIAINYILVSVVCLIVNYIYGKFGHGVTSNYMTYMFIIPLIMGSCVYFIIKRPNRIFKNIYNAGVATLIVGSFVKGIFEIAGTASKYEIVFLIVGFGLVILSIPFLKQKSG